RRHRSRLQQLPGRRGRGRRLVQPEHVRPPGRAQERVRPDERVPPQPEREAVLATYDTPEPGLMPGSGVNPLLSGRSAHFQTGMMSLGSVKSGVPRLALPAAVISAVIVVAAAMVLGRASGATTTTSAGPRTGVVVVNTKLAFEPNSA